jgi:hypothetical protein
VQAPEDEIQTEGAASKGLMEQFQQFCEAHGEKVDRIAHFHPDDGGARGVLSQ